MAKDPITENEPETGRKTAKEASRRNKQIRTGVAVGIGSAAIVAALLYANRGRKGDSSEN
jgi:hypothetical protein